MYSLLHETAGAGFTEEIMAFISAGGEVDVRDDGGETLLHWAARSGRTETVKALISVGADVNAKANNDGTPLHSALLSSSNTETANNCNGNGPH